MKRWSTTPVSKSSLAKKISLVSASILMVISIPLGYASMIGSVARADEFDERIRQVQAEIDQYQNKANELRAQGNTYQNAVNAFNNEILALQKEIDLNQAKHDQLVADIKLNEQKIVFNQDDLGKTIANIYVDDKISPFEMLASSKNIGDYVDKQEYRSSVRDRLTKAIDEIKKLKKELEKQKLEAERILADQKGRRTVLEGRQAEQQQLVAETRGEEAAYQTLTTQSRARKDALQKQQQDAIYAAMRRAGGGGRAVAGDPSKGGYPTKYANADYYAYIADDWGMYARQCVSYVAWKVEQKNGYMPHWGGDRYVTINGQRVFTSGHAKYWPTSAKAAGITTSRGLLPGRNGGFAAVITSGDYGHIVWVESVNWSDGTLNISQYNYFNAGGPGWGHYSEMYGVPVGAYDEFIYF